MKECAYQIADGLSFLHEAAGLVHRKICPDTIFGTDKVIVSLEVSFILILFIRVIGRLEDLVSLILLLNPRNTPLISLVIYSST